MFSNSKSVALWKNRQSETRQQKREKKTLQIYIEYYHKQFGSNIKCNKKSANNSFGERVRGGIRNMANRRENNLSWQVNKSQEMRSMWKRKKRSLTHTNQLISGCFVG